MLAVVGPIADVRNFMNVVIDLPGTHVGMGRCADKPLFIGGSTRGDPKRDQPDKSAVAGRLTLLCCSPDGARNFGSAPFLLFAQLVNSFKIYVLIGCLPIGLLAIAKMQLVIVFNRLFNAAIGREDGDEL